MEKYYENDTKGIYLDNDRVSVSLSKSDKLLGLTIKEISFSNEDNYPEILIELSNGKQIEIYGVEGRLHVYSD